jgi:hypothetical protein
MSRLRVLSGHPHLGRPGEIVREFEGAQAYVDAGFCEWVDPPETTDAVPVVVSRTQVVETTDAAGGAVETTSLAAADRARAGRAGTVATARRRT